MAVEDDVVFVHVQTRADTFDFVSAVYFGVTRNNIAIVQSTRRVKGAHLLND